MHDSRIPADGGILHRMPWHVTHDEGISWCGTTFRPVLVPVPSFGFTHPCSPHLVTVSGKSRVLPARRSVPSLEFHIMSRSHTLIAGPLFLAAALASHASAGVVINMVDDGADIRVTVTGWFNVNPGGTTQYGADIHQVTDNDLYFVERPAGEASVTMKNYSNTAGFSGDFEGSTLYDAYATVMNSSLPIFIKGFSNGSWTIAGGEGDTLATEANPYDWDVRWSNWSLAARGYKVGTYVWTLTDGTNTDSLTLNIGASTPAVPGVGALAAFGGAGLAGRRRRR
jgi:hypothetical protein